MKGWQLSFEEKSLDEAENCEVEITHVEDGEIIAKVDDFEVIALISFLSKRPTFTREASFNNSPIFIGSPIEREDLKQFNNFCPIFNPTLDTNPIIFPFLNFWVVNPTYNFLNVLNPRKTFSPVHL